MVEYEINFKENCPEPRSSGLLLNISAFNFLLIGGGNRKKAFEDIWQLSLEPIENSNSKAYNKSWQMISRINNDVDKGFSSRFGLTGAIVKNENQEIINIYLHGGQNHFTGAFFIDIYNIKFKKDENLSSTETSLSFPYNNLKIFYPSFNTYKSYFCSEFRNLIAFPIDIKNNPCARNSHSIAFDNKKSFYLFGGGNSEGLLNDLWQFDIETQKFSKFNIDSSKIPQREMHGMIFYKDNLYIFGGRLYDLIDNKMYRINLGNMNVDNNFTSLPISLCSFSYALYKNYIIIYGGTDGIIFMNCIFIYNLNNNKWAKSKINVSNNDKYFSDGKIGSHMSVDEEMDLLVIFGGSTIQVDSNDTFVVSMQELLNENNLIQA